MHFSKNRRIAKKPLQAALVAGAILGLSALDRLLMTFWQSGRMHKRRPEVPLHLAPASGHMVHHSAPEVVMQAIQEAFQLSQESTPRAARVPMDEAPIHDPLSDELSSHGLTQGESRPSPQNEKAPTLWHRGQ